VHVHLGNREIGDFIARIADDRIDQAATFAESQR
jgi:hypothetical protein